MTTFVGRTWVTVQEVNRDPKTKITVIKAQDQFYTNVEFEVPPSSNYVPQVGDRMMLSVSHCES